MGDRRRFIAKLAMVAAAPVLALSGRGTATAKEMPRCRDCRWWEDLDMRSYQVDRSTDGFEESHDGAGRCDFDYMKWKSEEGHGLAWGEDYGGWVVQMVTRPDFGCVQFQAKE